MKWDYSINDFQAEILSDLERVLAAAGADGWELVIITPFPGIPPPMPPVSLAVFKRPAASNDLDVSGGGNVTVNVRLAP